MKLLNPLSNSFVGPIFRIQLFFKNVLLRPHTVRVALAPLQQILIKMSSLVLLYHAGHSITVLKMNMEYNP